MKKLLLGITLLASMSSLASTVEGLFVGKHDGCTYEARLVSNDDSNMIIMFDIYQNETGFCRDQQSGHYVNRVTTLEKSKDLYSASKTTSDLNSPYKRISHVKIKIHSDNIIEIDHFNASALNYLQYGHKLLLSRVTPSDLSDLQE